MTSTTSANCSNETKLMEFVFRGSHSVLCYYVFAKRIDSVLSLIHDKSYFYTKYFAQSS